MIIKSILAASTIALSATAAVAVPVDPGFSQGASLTRGDAFNIRACRADFPGPIDSVCFNRINTFTVGSFTRNFERVTKVSCDRRVYPDTQRGRIATEFCPQLEAGTLYTPAFIL